MVNNKTPIITYAEILCLAIESLQAKIQEWDVDTNKITEKSELTQSILTEIRDKTMARIAPKIEALKSIYKIETGVDYN